MLAEHNITTVHILVKKTINTLKPTKDNLGLRTYGVYSIPCECGEVYGGQTSRMIKIRCQKPIRHL